MDIDFGKFLLSFAAAVAAAASPALTVGVDLFVHQANEDLARAGAAGPIYAVLTQYQGQRIVGTRPVATPSVQVMALSKSPGDAWALITRIFNALFQTDDGAAIPRPWHDRLIPGKVFSAGNGGAVASDPAGDWFLRYLAIKQQPGLIGVDDADRHKIVFNLELRVERS